jgi:hypothetical protein
MSDNAPRLAPIDSTAPYALRMMLIRRYWYLTLKFSHPYISESGRWEASWNGGNTEADTQHELLAKTLEELEDCGGEEHFWKTIDEKRDSANSDNVLLTQRRICDFCDAKVRVISIFHPNPTAIESCPDDNAPCT